jgi:transposase
MSRYGRLLPNAQSKKIRPLLPKRQTSEGWKAPKDDRNVLVDILWSLRSGARWCDLPEEFPSSATCWRRLRDWEEQEVW